jgi:hypothetical protein
MACTHDLTTGSEAVKVVYQEVVLGSVNDTLKSEWCACCTRVLAREHLHSRVRMTYAIDVVHCAERFDVMLGMAGGTVRAQMAGHRSQAQRPGGCRQRPCMHDECELPSRFRMLRGTQLSSPKTLPRRLFKGQHRRPSRFRMLRGTQLS